MACNRWFLLIPHNSILSKNPQLQSGYEPPNLENGSFLNSDNFDATDLRFYSEG